MIAGWGPAPDARMACAFPTAQVSVGGRLRNGRVRRTARHAAAREVVRLEGCPQPHPAASVPRTVPQSAEHLTAKRRAPCGDAEHVAATAPSTVVALVPSEELMRDLVRLGTRGLTLAETLRQVVCCGSH